MAKGLLALLAPEKGDEREEDDELTDAMRDLLDAIGEKDPKAMALAFERAHEACAMHEEPDEDDKEEKGY